MRSSSVFILMAITVIVGRVTVKLYGALSLGPQPRKVEEINLSTGERKNIEVFADFCTQRYCPYNRAIVGKRHSEEQSSEGSRGASTKSASSFDALCAAKDGSCTIPRKEDKELSQCWHTIQDGETLQSIAEQHGINWKSLWLINDISEPHNLQPGSNIRIGRDYLVAPNESLATVVHSMRITWQRLLKANPHSIKTLHTQPVVVDVEADYAGSRLCIVTNFASCSNDGN